jgi:hypothetical protein
VEDEDEKNERGRLKSGTERVLVNERRRTKR